MPDVADQRSDDRVLLVEVDERVATVTLHRPEARNALNAELRRELPRAMRALDADDAVDVVILTGADPAFCAGLDLKELGSGGNDLRGAGADGSQPREQRGPFPPMAKPVIGAVNGVAITGGFELALACDLLIASDRARFADTHARVGIMPGWGLTVLLPQAIGLRRAREMSTTGNFVDAETALAWGLVNHVVDHDDLLPYCRKLASDIVSNDQRAVQRVNQTYDDGALLTGADAWELEGRVAAEWTKGFDPGQVEQRRRAVMERGRRQI